MFSFPRLLSLRGKRSLIFSIASLCLLVFVPGIQAQQLSVPGLQSPAEKKSAKQELPSRIRAARGEAPLGRLYDNLKVEPLKIRRLPALEAREMEKEATSKRMRVGTVRAFQRPLDVSSDSALYRVAEGEVRVMGIVSEGALYTRVHFSHMSLPKGARVFVYSLKNPEEFYGPYEGHGASPDGTFWTPPMEGDGAVIEYFSPSTAIDSRTIPFQVSEISHIYRSLFTKESSEEAAGACNLEVASDWLNVAKSVGYLEFTSGGFEYACTGTLLNNPDNDQTPYLLTANHCFDTQTEAQTLRVYWNYNTGDSPPGGTPFTDGANLLSTSSSSDFSFVRLTGALPAGLFFSGWDASPTPVTTSITGIHHPDGSHKRISFGSTISGCENGFPGQCQYYTRVHWNSGTTEPGSSGSGLWKGSSSDPRLVGTLSGGSASCSNPSGSDYYGSFSQTYPFIASFLQHGDNGADDALEDNDTRSVAKALDGGTYSNLVVKGIDEDWYKLSGVAGNIVGAKITFAHSSGNINLQLYRAGDASPVSSSDGTSDSERVNYVNQSGTTEDYYLRVYAPPGVQNTYTLTVGGTGAACAATPVNYGQTINGSLNSSDCRSWRGTWPSTNGTFFADRYSFTAQQGQQIAVSMIPETSFNTFLTVNALSDDPNQGKPGSTLSFLATYTGTYTIEATSFDPNVTGNYQIVLGGQAETVTLAQAEYIVREDEGRVALIVNRGPNALVEATVGYATNDASGLNECSRVSGFGSSRCDYATTLGTLRFAPGERVKTIFIPLVDDAFVEGRESLNLTLYNLIGGVYGPYQSAMIYIDDNDSTAGANPMNQTPFFVRQHYIDFLGREPDAGGYTGWQSILNNCPPSGKDANGNYCDRIEVSAGFFRSPEFQERGYFVYRFSSAVGKIPLYEGFMPDFAKVSGFLSAQQLEDNKVAFINEFMARGDFLTKYGALTNPTAYVDALLQTVGLPTHPGRAGWIAGLTNSSLTRAQVLRALVESGEVYQKYYTEAFVIMQYFGYLRRSADASYLNWIQTMNSTGGDYRTMIDGFLNSAEYRNRFGN